LNHVHSRPDLVPDAVARDGRWIRRRRCETRRYRWCVSAANLKRQIRGSERSWNCVGGKPAGSDRYVVTPARGHGLGIVWNSRNVLKVIFFSGDPYGNTETTARLFKSKQCGVRNPAPRRGSDGATDRPSGARQRTPSGQGGHDKIWRST